MASILGPSTAPVQQMSAREKILEKFKTSQPEKIGSPISAQPKRKIPYQRSQSTPSGGPSSSKNSLNQSSIAIEKMKKMSGTSEEQEKLKSAQKSKQSSESNGNTSSKGY